MKFSNGLKLALAWLCASAALAQGAATPITLYEGADREQRLLAGARKEGTLVFYTSIAEKDLAVLGAAFEKKYGVKVKVWRAGTDKVLQRSLTEAAAGRHDVDLMHIGSPEMEIMHREKLLQPAYSPYQKDLIASAVPAHHEWTATLLSVWVQAYNTTKIKKQDLPKTYLDLLDPKWKGMLGIEAKNEDWFASVVNELGEEKGLKFFRDLMAGNGLSIRKGHSLLNNLVVAGEVPLALSVYNYMPEAAKQKGAPIDWFAIEPAVARANGIGIAKQAPHPYAAALFYDFMLSDAQNLLVDMDYVPTSRKVKSPLAGVRIKLVDPVTTIDEAAKWTKLFEDVVIKVGAK